MGDSYRADDDRSFVDWKRSGRAASPPRQSADHDGEIGRTAVRNGWREFCCARRGSAGDSPESAAPGGSARGVARDGFVHPRPGRLAPWRRWVFKEVAGLTEPRLTRSGNEIARGRLYCGGAI